MSIAYFAHELADPAVQKRVRMLAAGGRDVKLLGFERKRAMPANFAASRPYVLGRTENGRFLARAVAVLFAIPRAWGLRRVWSQADALLARNLEMLVIVALLKSVLGLKTRIAYECLDIHRLMLRQDWIGRAFRAVERACLKQVSAIVTSSPAFDANYFRAMQGWRGETLIVENKVLALAEAGRARQAPPAGPPWKIVWCGVLRCRASFEALRALAQSHGDRVTIELWGVPSLDQIPDFHEKVAATPGLCFKGSYDNLAMVYAGAHYVWAIDYYEAGGNSDWLLPNRLYEGLYSGVTPIAVAGVETARWLQARNVGVILDAPLSASAPAFIDALTPDAYAAHSAAVAALDPQLVAYSADNCRALIGHLLGAEARA